MWRYDMGWAIETGAWYSPFIVYDLDGDGFAEVYAKAGEGDPREIDGRVIEGPEFLVKIDGRTGVVIGRREWHSREGWSEYNRSQRHMLAVAYLDGENPSLIMQRGTYDLIKTMALDKNLETIWRRELRNPHELAGPGTHGLIAADVDGDGRDELILGATALDDAGNVLWESGLGHPDVCHVADIDPDNPGLEVFLGIEPRRDSHGVALLSARDGRVLWHYDGPTRARPREGDDRRHRPDPSRNGVLCRGTGRQPVLALRGGRDAAFGPILRDALPLRRLVGRRPAKGDPGRRAALQVPGPRRTHTRTRRAYRRRAHARTCRSSGSRAASSKKVPTNPFFRGRKRSSFRELSYILKPTRKTIPPRIYWVS
jgi:hypothetical protein